MNDRLIGRTALVTGSTSNIGRAIAEALAAEGAHVVVSGRDPVRGEEVVAGIRAGGGRADFAAADLDGTPAAAEALVTAATALLGGRIDVLVNNAGIYPAASTDLIDEPTSDRIMAVNVKSPYFLTRAIVPGMIARGGGAVIDLGSWIARLAVPSGSAYSATKGALETLTRAWAAEYGPRGVRVNAISPGVIRSLDLGPGEETPGGALMAGTPAGVPGPPAAIGAAAVYLASDDAAFVHGTVLDVDGGRVAVAQAAA